MNNNQVKPLAQILIRGFFLIAGSILFTSDGLLPITGGPLVGLGLFAKMYGYTEIQ